MTGWSFDTGDIESTDVYQYIRLNKMCMSSIHHLYDISVRYTAYLKNKIQITSLVTYKYVEQGIFFIYIPWKEQIQ